MESNLETVYGVDGSKVGVTVREGSDWVAYNLSDVEVYRGNDGLLAAWVLWNERDYAYSRPAA